MSKADSGAWGAAAAGATTGWYDDACVVQVRSDLGRARNQRPRIELGQLGARRADDHVQISAELDRLLVVRLLETKQQHESMTWVNGLRVSTTIFTPTGVIAA